MPARGSPCGAFERGATSTENVVPDWWVTRRGRRGPTPTRTGRLGPRADATIPSRDRGTATMSQGKPTASSHRLNLRAAIVLGVGTVVLASSFFAFKAYRQRHSRDLFLREAKARLEAKDARLALQY